MAPDDSTIKRAPMRIVAASPTEPSGAVNPTQYAPIPGGPLTTVRDSSKGPGVVQTIHAAQC